jgi:hypothetical protein
VEVRRGVRPEELARALPPQAGRRRHRRAGSSRSGARSAPGHDGSRESIRDSDWSPASAGVPLTWLCPLAEPNEGMAPEALMDGWFPGSEGRPTSPSHPEENRARNRAQAQACRSERSRSCETGRSMPTHRAHRRGVGLTSLSMDIGEADTSLRPRRLPQSRSASSNGVAFQND